MLAPTPQERWTDADGRPYFLWHCDVTLDRLSELLNESDEDVRAYWLGTVMRQAKPDDALMLASRGTMRSLWPRLELFLGKQREFWAWYLAATQDDEE